MSPDLEVTLEHKIMPSPEADAWLTENDKKTPRPSWQMCQGFQANDAGH